MHIVPAEPAREPFRARGVSVSRPTDGAESCRLALAIAAAAYDVAPDAICSPTRGSLAVSDARHVAVYLAHIVFQLTMSEVAVGFGRDRTTIGHAIRRVEDRRDDEGFENRLGRLEHLAEACRLGTSGRGAAI